MAAAVCPGTGEKRTSEVTTGETVMEGKSLSTGKREMIPKMSFLKMTFYI